MEFTYEEECYMAKNKAADDLLHFLEWNYESTDATSIDNLRYLAARYAMQCEELKAAQRLTRKENHNG